MASDVTLSYSGVEITVLAGECLQGGKPTRQAVAYYQGLVSRLDALREYVADELLDLHNNVWSDDEAAPIDRETFVARLVNPAIVLMEPDRASVYFEDSDLFLGHGIEVRIEGTAPVDVGLVG
jgi:hypothetical protein